MKEFVEKLIQRLEAEQKYQYEKAEEADKKINLEMISISEARRKSGQCFDVAIQVIEQLAEEYKHCSLCYLGSPCEYQNAEADCEKCESYDNEKHHCTKFCKVITEAVAEIEENHNDWIPCSERLPGKEECGRYGRKEFQVTIHQLYGEDKVIAMDYEYAVIRGKEVGRWKWCGRLSPWEVIAWKPMSEPYVPAGN